MYPNSNNISIRGSVFKRKINDLHNYINNRRNCNILYNYGGVRDFSRLEGFTVDYGDGLPKCGVNIPNVHNLSNINNKYFVEIVVDSFHEVAHFNQLKSGNHSLSYVAYMNNKNLYYDNYRDNKREIAAEYKGVVGAYNYLRKLDNNTDIIAEKYLIDYVNERVSFHNYWIKSDNRFDNILDILSAFEQRLAETMEVENNCCYKSRLKIGNRLPVEDEAALCMEPWKQEQSVWYPVYDSMNHSENTEVMEKKFACLACYLHPEYFDRFPELKKYDLKPEHAFGFPFPESAESVNKRIKECLHGSGSTRKTFTYKEQDFGNRQVITPDTWNDYYNEQYGGMEL